MKNNKGYSLVELLLTLVVFGFVMIGIVTIMRTTTVSYKDGNAEVTMQTEAQIVTNQIEELLVDATGSVVPGTLSSGTFAGEKVLAISSSSGDKHYIALNSAEKRLYYSQTALDSDWSLMAEYVKDFGVNGWDTTSTSADCDNMVVLYVEMEKSDYTYTAVKDVYFRNAIEDKTVQQIDDGSTTAIPGTTVIEKVADIERYAIVDLVSEYDLDLTAGVTISDTTNFSSMYEFVNVTYNTGTNKDFMNSITGISSAGTTPGRYIRTLSTVNVDFTKSLSKDDASAVYLSGKTTDGSSIKIYLTTKAVSYNVNSTSVTADGFVTLSTQTGNTERYNQIVVDGINLVGLLNSELNPVDANRNVQFKMVMYKDADNDKTYDASEKEGNGVRSGTLTSVGGSGTTQQIDGTTMLEIGMAIDNVTGDLAVQAREVGSSAVELFNGNSDNSVPGGKYRIAFFIYIPNQLSAGQGTWNDVVDLNLFVQGGDISRFSGGNTYDCSWTDAQWN